MEMPTWWDAAFVVFRSEERAFQDDIFLFKMLSGVLYTTKNETGCHVVSSQFVQTAIWIKPNKTGGGSVGNCCPVFGGSIWTRHKYCLLRDVHCLACLLQTEYNLAVLLCSKTKCGGTKCECGATFLSAAGELIEVNLWFAALAPGTVYDTTWGPTVACSSACFTYLQTVCLCLLLGREIKYTEHLHCLFFMHCCKFARLSPLGAADDLFSFILNCLKVPQASLMSYSCSPVVTVTRNKTANVSTTAEFLSFTICLSCQLHHLNDEMETSS